MGNIPLFISFRLFFNARWYYPVMAILFLDFGLSLEQYAMLNVAWAVSIVCLEVPSGALADRLGRRRMIVLAGGLMVIEMALFAFAPIGSPWLFPMLLLNRVLSGAAEACASGADESLAFDSLREEGREAEWPSVLARLMRLQSIAFFITMLIGAAVYDPVMMQHVANFLGADITITHLQTLRWPLYLTLGNAVVVFLITLRMREPRRLGTEVPVASTWRQMANAAQWITRTRLVLLVILAGVCVDSVIRLFLTLGSNYYRLIQLPEASFGIIASGFSIVGFFSPKLAVALIKRRTMRFNFAVASALALVGLCTAAVFIPYWGVLVVLPFAAAMSLLQLFVSHYLNTFIHDSSQRATVMSFKGLVFNLGYGAAGLGFAAFTHARRNAGNADVIFMEAFRWFPAVFVCLLVALWISARSTTQPVSR